jgi:hypothetical protein
MVLAGRRIAACSRPASSQKERRLGATVLFGVATAQAFAALPLFLMGDRRLQRRRKLSVFLAFAAARRWC